jgi:uncharacterized protein
MAALQTDQLPDIFNLERLVPIFQSYNVARLCFFGSFSRGAARPGSDGDLLVEFDELISLIKLISLEYALKDEIGRDVDLISEISLSVYLREEILNDLRLI